MNTSSGEKAICLPSECQATSCRCTAAFVTYTIMRQAPAGMPHHLPTWLQIRGDLLKAKPTRWKPKVKTVKKFLGSPRGTLALRWGFTQLRSSLVGKRPLKQVYTPLAAIQSRIQLSAGSMSLFPKTPGDMNDQEGCLVGTCGQYYVADRRQMPCPSKL